jgi:hypothetical protein
MPSPKGGSVLVMELVRELGKLNSELAVLVGDDGCLYLAHRFTPNVLHAKIDLKTDPLTVTELEPFPPHGTVYDEWFNMDEWLNRDDG